MQLARSNKTIATIVTFAADHADGAEVKMLLRELGHGRASVLHQGKRWHAVFLSGCAINGAHFFSGNNLHA